MIGVFDSGFGGLTVVTEILKQMPGIEILYYADIENFPYGSKSPDKIRAYSNKITDYLLKEDIEALVIACNTASSIVADDLKRDLDIPVIDVVSSAVESLERLNIGSLGLIATEATIKNGLLEEKIRRSVKEVRAKACPDMVRLAQAMGSLPGGEDIIESCLGSFKGEIDTLYLGCTHFPLLKDQILAYMGKIQMVDPAYWTAKKLAQVLEDYKKTSNFYIHFSQVEEGYLEDVETILPDQVKIIEV